MADIAEMRTGTHLLDAAVHALVRNLDQAPPLYRWLAHEKHAAGVSVKSVLDHGHVDVNDVALFQALFARYAVTNLVIHRGAYRSREAPVVERCGNRVLLVNDVVMA